LVTIANAGVAGVGVAVGVVDGPTLGEGIGVPVVRGTPEDVEEKIDLPHEEVTIAMVAATTGKMAGILRRTAGDAEEVLSDGTTVA
jgi:hypothetical protein